MDVIHEKITDKKIKIPENILEILGLKSGEDIEMRVVGRTLVIEPVKDPIDKLTGILEVKDPDIKRLIESDEWY